MNSTLIVLLLINQWIIFLLCPPVKCCHCTVLSLSNVSFVPCFHLPIIFTRNARQTMPSYPLFWMNVVIMQNMYPLYILFSDTVLWSYKRAILSANGRYVGFSVYTQIHSMYKFSCLFIHHQHDLKLCIHRDT
jgi:hypothetical protein